MKIDVIGDVHGCMDELRALFTELGYVVNQDGYSHPDGRIPVFVGDITDRGPNSLAVIRLVYKMVVETKIAHYVPGNHCNKLYRFFLGNKVQQKHGLETTVAEYNCLNTKDQKKISKQFKTLYEQAPLYLHLKELGVIIAHAGIKESFIGKTDKKVKTFVLYGDISGEFDTSGRPIRRDWAKHYQGDPWVVYGHTPVKEARKIGKTINIDTGCVFGNKLTAFRFPEIETVTVPSKQPLQEEKFTYFS